MWALMTGLVPADVEAVVPTGGPPDGFPGEETEEVEEAIRPGCPEGVCVVAGGFD